ncbi:lipoprotein [Streptomyces thermospinosisporus]|uniref:Lipoprotein n=1 Tax=Streptomyces thermospinosisporus TaxID=161482 RepID=A0ABP4JRG6_9ACTN
MRRTALATLCLIAVTGAGLTGCLPGEDKASKASEQSEGVKDGKDGKNGKKEPFAGLSGGEIADRAVAATTGASSLRMRGDVPDEAAGAMTFDMALDRKGECAGTLTMKSGGEAELIKTGDTLYIKYDEAFLRAQSEGEPKADVDAAVDLLAGKWTKMSATGADAEEIAGFCDLDEVLGDVEEGGSTASRGRTTTVDGTPALTLTERDGKDRYTIYVATEGEPYLLRLDSTADGDSPVTFSDYEKPVPAKKPEGEIVDLDALG